MYKKKPAWRNTATDTVSFHQEQALNTTIFLLKSYGPTRFLLQEDGDTKHKVCLGDVHTCTCPAFHRDRDLCKHICWVLMRKFRLPRDHEYCFQHGLGERQIAEVLQGSCGGGRAPQTQSSGSPGTPCEQAVDPQEDGCVIVRQKSVEAQDVCPICQEGLLEKRLPVAHCRFGCGNNVHISCMKVWAEHQTRGHHHHQGEQQTVRCPLCREAFSSLKLLEEQARNAAALHTAAERERPETHLGVVCHGCRACPVTGTCFKCTVCSHCYLCEACVKRSCHPPQHPLVSRTKRREKWQYAEHRLIPLPDDPSTSQSADDSKLADEDCLERHGTDSGGGSSLPARVLECLPTVRVRTGSRLLHAGQQCRICLQSFALGQRVRTLPCHHKFHAGCVNRVLRASDSCPLDGYVVYSPLPAGERAEKTSGSSSKPASRRAHSDVPEKDATDLFVPGVSLLARRTAPRVPPLRSLEVLPGPAMPGNAPEGLLTDDALQGPRANAAAAMGRNAETQRERRSPRHFAFPGRSYTFNERGKRSSSDGPQHSAPSRKTLGQRGPALVPNTGQRARAAAGLFAGTKTAELEPYNNNNNNTTAFMAVPAWRTGTRVRAGGPAPLRADRKDRPPTELTMTGVLMNAQQKKKKSYDY